MFLTEDSSAHQGCIYLVKNTEETATIVKYYYSYYYSLNDYFPCTLFYV